ncbi:MAG: AraC family transcriptional regulator [Planctomycetota bacterium]
MRNETRHIYEQRILAVLVYLQQHLDVPLSLEDLAGQAHFSPFHFHRIFRGMVGESVQEHIRRLRMERAAHRLKYSDHSVIQIAIEAGYEAHESFTRRFRQVFGASPTEYRQLKQAPAYPVAASSVHFASDGSVNSFVPVAGPTLEVEVVTIKPRRVAFVRHVGPYHEVGQAWSKLFSWAMARNLVGSMAPMIGLLHDDPDVTPADRIRYDACFTAPDSLVEEGEIGIQVIRGGAYAVATHLGPYERIGESYAVICGQWLPTSHWALETAPGFEIYRNSPLTTPPENLLTDVHMPLRAI